MSSFIKTVLVFASGFLLCQYTHEAEAQTVQLTDNRGYSIGTVQINGNTAQFVNPMGVTTQTATIYPNQVVITSPQGTTVVGQPSYTVPPSPLTPMTPRVMQ
jgi:hypothetical protein